MNPKCSTHNFVKYWPILKIFRKRGDGEGGEEMRKEKGRTGRGVEKDGRGGKKREEKMRREGVHNLRKMTPIIRWLVTGLIT